MEEIWPQAENEMLGATEKCWDCFVVVLFGTSGSRELDLYLLTVNHYSAVISLLRLLDFRLIICVELHYDSSNSKVSETISRE